VGRFEVEREGLPAIALTTDSSVLTSISNDYGFSMVFARQVTALATAGDVLIAISTSGNSDNIVRAVEAAKHRDTTTIGLLGKGGGQLAQLVDQALIVPASNTARIQEAHIMIGHILCECVDRARGASHV
jgi:D-sedoheptulose 7-phosphate isomerase